MRPRKRWLALGIAVVLACVFAAGLAASQLGSGPPPPDVVALASASGVAPMIRIADIAPGNGQAARGVFAQITSVGQFCLWDAPSASSSARGGGCNPVDDPLGGHPLSASFAYDGGPAPADVKDARLIGLVAKDVADVDVVMSDGSRLKLALRRVPSSVGDFLVFAHRFGRGQLAHGTTPTAVIALDANGTQIDRQATGF
jgi:hypothetical protein